MGTQITNWFVPYTVTPNRLTSPATFSSDRDIRLQEEDGNLTKYNAFGLQLNDIGEEVEANALSASNSAVSSAESALISKSAANYQGVWTSKGYTVGQSVKGSDGVIYQCDVTHTTAQNPTSTTGYWSVNIPVGAIGNINNPLLDLPLNNSLVMKQGVGSVTFTRATTGTFIDRYGVLQTAAIDEPRFEKEGLLIEGGSTNNFIYSEQFDNAIWSKANLSVNANVTTSPDGNVTADKLIPTASNISHYFQQYIDTTDGISVTTKIFAKNDGYYWVQIAPWVGFAPGYVNINLTTGEITNNNLADGGTIEIKELAGSWFEISVTQVANATLVGTARMIVAILNADIATSLPSFTGDGTSGVSFFGGQSEDLPFASSYIPTNASTVTRGVDDCQVTFADNMVAETEAFTILVDYKLIANDGAFKTTWNISNESFRYFSNRPTSQFRVGNIESEVVGHDPSISSRVGCVYDKTSANIYIDGVLGSSETGLFSVLGVHNYIELGNREGLDYLFGHIKNFRIYDKALTASEIALA